VTNAAGLPEYRWYRSDPRIAIRFSSLLFLYATMQVLDDLLIGLKRFQNAVRWKYHWMGQKGKDEVGDMDEDSSTASIESFQIDDPGLGSGVVPKESKSTGPRADDKTGAFLKDVTETLLNSQRGDKWENFGLGRMGRSQGVADRLKHSDCYIQLKTFIHLTNGVVSDLKLNAYVLGLN